MRGVNSADVHRSATLTLSGERSPLTLKSQWDGLLGGGAMTRSWSTRSRLTDQWSTTRCFPPAMATAKLDANPRGVSPLPSPLAPPDTARSQIPRAPFIEDVAGFVGGDIDGGPALDRLQEMLKSADPLASGRAHLTGSQKVSLHGVDDRATAQRAAGQDPRDAADTTDAAAAPQGQGV